MTEISEIFNFLVIEPLLTTSGQPTEEAFSALAEKGYEVIINLALHDDQRYSLADEAKLVESLGMKYIHIPVQFDAPTENDLETFFKAMGINKGKKVHVHCAANLRVTSFLGLYFYIKQGKSKEEVYALIRTFWAPDDVWASFVAGIIEKQERI